jgi:hypothetical protein
MRNFLAAVVVFGAALGMSLATPALSRAGDPCCCGQSVVIYSSSGSYYYAGPPQATYSSGTWYTSPATVYYPASYSRYNQGGARWGRYGNVIINRRRWGDLENRVSYGDLIRW